MIVCNVCKEEENIIIKKVKSNNNYCVNNKWQYYCEECGHKGPLFLREK